MDGEDKINRLGAYLRARRDLVSPTRVGLPAGDNRRVPGLRREEVAMLAGISVDYYLRLERGRDAHPSVQVLESIARVLQLDDVEREYLIGLAADRPRVARKRKAERVPPRLHHLLATIGLPAFVEGRSFDVLASNELAVALSPRIAPGYNRLRSLLLDPEEQAFQVDWEDATEGIVAALRANIGADVDDPRFVELVGELAISSARFRALWGRHDVHPLEGGTALLDHPIVGELRLNRDKLPVDDVLLVVYYPDAGSESDEKLRMLARLAETPAAAAPPSSPGVPDAATTASDMGDQRLS